RLPDRQDPRAPRRRRAQRQAECAVPGAAQPAGGRAAGQLRRAIRRRPAPALLPHHRRRACRLARLGRRVAGDPRLRRCRPGGDTRMNSKLPTTIPEYLEHLRRSLAGADPALIQDALYDAEEYLRSELVENPGRSEAEVIAAVASSYGA